MKTISGLSRALIVGVVTVGAWHSPAAANGVSATWIGIAVTAQAGRSDLTPEDRRRRATDLMSAARQSMKSGNWDAAESQVTRAEDLEASFGLLHLGDTPKKVRQDLERLRAKAAAGPGMLQRLSPFRKSKDEEDASENPFAGRPADPALPAAGSAPARAGAAADREANLANGRPPQRTRPRFEDQTVDEGSSLPRPGALGDVRSEQAFGPDGVPPGALPSNPRGNATNPARPASDPRATANRPPVGAPTPEQRQPVAERVSAVEAAPADPKAQSDRLLLAARRALARSDTRRALGLVEQAQAMGIQYTLTEDTPSKIGAAIERQQAITEIRAAHGDSESLRREQADFMMEQAEALVHWGDFDEAERLAQDVTQLRVEFGPFDAHPNALLQRIAAGRRGAAGGGPMPPAGEAHDVATDESLRLARARVVELVAAARAALDIGDFRQADKLARQAAALQLPEGMYAADEDRPEQVLHEIQQARGGSGVRLAGGNPSAPSAQGVERAVYDPQRDPTRNVRTAGNEPIPSDSGANARNPNTPPENGGEPAIFPPTGQPAALAGKPMQAPGQLKNPQPAALAADLDQALGLIERGEASLTGGDRNTALVYFRQAGAFNDALPPEIRQRLATHLAQLDREPPAQPISETVAAPVQTAPSELDELPPLPAPAALPGSLLDKTTAEQQVAARQLSTQVSRKLADARKLREANDPRQSLTILNELRATAESSNADDKTRQQYMLRIDRAISETERYLEVNRIQIEAKEQNAQVKAQVDREQQMRVEVDNKLALLVEEFNQLMDERRFHEADVVARKAEEMAPDNPVVQQLKWTSRFSRREMNSTNLRDDKEAGFVAALDSVERSSTPFNDMNPYEFPNLRDWEKLTKIRKSFPGDEPHRNEREVEIIKKLRTPVSLQFEDAPLSEVLSYLAKLAQINLHLDQLGLSEEGVTTDTPVTIDLNQEISLKSALNLILEPLHLSYIIKDEVLKVTSEQFRDGNIVPKTYPVADLVIPIPNFVPGPKMGMAGALSEAYNTLGYNGAPGFGGQTPMAVVASRDGTPNSAVINPAILANTHIGDNRGTLASSLSGATQPLGPGGAGGGAAADYDSLIRLITTTIAPTTWDEVGGSGAISPFRGNLSLVISNTEEVHDQIRDLLQQLRRLQDLQVTIEVRFITLNDNFFERIGIDFDFDINSNLDKPFQIFGRTDPASSTTYQTPPFTANGGPPRDVQDRNLTRSESVSVGLTAPGVFSTDLDVPFRQDSFTLAVPQFGGFDPTAGASFGFAILSDIETYFFLNAAQGDRRSNVLQAPKVTLFNGQQASVSDTSQSPFVISVIPVVGDFAAAQQPVIIVLSEGTFMTVQAVVSSDRRFVRLTVVPFFSNIGDVSTFTFTGSSTTTETSRSDGPTDDTTARDNERTTITEGTTVQLPTFSFVTVTTTVSVPDGGTVLLGGIKRLSEGRTEFGVPILNKLPYVSRLFKNVGIGRQTESLMMMVTPRIIIQEEEESLLGLNPAPAPNP